MDHSFSCLDLSSAVVSDRCHLRIPSLPDWVEPTVDYLIRRATQCGAVHASRATRLMLALHEALTNAIIHGNLGLSSDLKEQGDRAFADALSARCADPHFGQRHVDIEADYDGERLSWTFTDQGDGFDVAQTLQRLDEPSSDGRSFGRGLVLMRAFVDEMRYEEGGRRLVLIVRREQAREKRAHARWPFLRGIRVTPVNSDGSVDTPSGRDALAHNVSATGIGLFREHHDGRPRVLITLPNEHGEPISLHAEVRHWHRLGDQVVEVGCRFEAPMTLAPPDTLPGSRAEETAAALQRLLTQRATQHKPHDDRRAAPRVVYRDTVLIDLPDGSTLPGFGRDLSRLGIAFYTTQPVAFEVVRLRLPQGSGGDHFVIHARIVRCTRLLDGFHDVAAQFLMM